MSQLNNPPVNGPSFPVRYYGESMAVSKKIQAGATSWHIPEEVPIAFVYNKRNYAVMMGTPADLSDYALGFSLTEKVVKHSKDILSLDIYLSERGADLRFKITEAALERLDTTLRRRNIVGSASCGLCGLENSDALFVTLPRVSQIAVELENKVLVKSMSSLPKFQSLNSQTHSVHAAAWVSLEGDILFSREDVGRHNALDKLLGCLEIEETDIKTGFVLMSSRCSYEIVEKAAYRGIKAILSISGPTAFALRKAQEANMAIYSRSGDGAVRLL